MFFSVCMKTQEGKQVCIAGKKKKTNKIKAKGKYFYLCLKVQWRKIFERKMWYESVFLCPWLMNFWIFSKTSQILKTTVFNTILSKQSSLSICITILVGHPCIEQ